MTQPTTRNSENAVRMTVGAGCLGFLCMLLFANSWLGMIPLAIIFLWLLIMSIRNDVAIQPGAVEDGSN